MGGELQNSDHFTSTLFSHNCIFISEMQSFGNNFQIPIFPPCADGMRSIMAEQ